jgi:hypothetical protein
MNSNVLHIIKFKNDFFNYKDSTNDLLLYQGLSLKTGYTLKLLDSRLIYKSHDKYLLSLNNLYRILQNSSGLNILGPQKYWSSNDEYIFTIHHKNQTFKQSIVLQEPFNQTLEIPFECFETDPLEITLELKEFGGQNLRAWNFYINSDYDTQALNSLTKLNPNWGFPAILRDIEFLYQLEKNLENNNSWINLKVLKNLNLYHKHLLYNYNKIELLKKQKQALVFNDLGYGNFKCQSSLGYLTNLKINLNLYLNLKVILPFKLYGQILIRNLKFIFGKLWQ